MLKPNLSLSVGSIKVSFPYKWKVFISQGSRGGHHTCHKVHTGFISASQRRDSVFLGKRLGQGSFCLHHEFASFLQHSLVEALHPLGNFTVFIFICSSCFFFPIVLICATIPAATYFVDNTTFLNT